MIHLRNSQIEQFNTVELKTIAPEILLIRKEKDLVDYLSSLKNKERLASHIAGELSNTILGDHIEHPLVLFRDGDFINIVKKKDRAEVRVSGSFKLDSFIDHLCDNNICGAELLSGIPGTVGAGISQNVAAYGQQLSTSLSSLKVLNLQTNTVESINPLSLRFGYRSSLLKDSVNYSPDRVILEATFYFDNDFIQSITYKDLLDHHRSMGRDPYDLKARRLSVIEVRNKKGMIVGGTNWVPCAGSFFLSPVVDEDRADLIVRSVRGSEFADSFLSWYKPDKNQTRLPAAIVLRAAGFLNGDRWGSVGLSPHHILALCSYGKETSGSDIYNLSNLIADKVKHLFDIDLQEEVRFLGSIEKINKDLFLKNNDFVPGLKEPEWVEDFTPRQTI